MPFNVPFCTITSYSSIEYGNDKISDGTLSNPYTLKITSLSPALYPITPSDFRVIGAIQSGFGAAFYDTIQGHPEIEKVEFIQSFDDVDVVITLVGSFAMDDQNQTIDICIEGSPTISTTVTGNIFNITTSNL